MVTGMHDTSHTSKAPFGWLGFALGAAALVMTMVTFWAGPFAAQQSAGVSLGELAAEIAKSAARSVAGQDQPAPMVAARNIDDYLRIGVSLLAGLAIVAGVASFARHEGKRAAFSGITLGGLAVGFQLFTWAIMLIVGVIAIASLIYALRDTLQDIFGGLFDA